MAAVHLSAIVGTLHGMWMHVKQHHCFNSDGDNRSADWRDSGRIVQIIFTTSSRCLCLSKEKNKEFSSCLLTGYFYQTVTIFYPCFGSRIIYK
jgi:hypothetical protein